MVLYKRKSIVLPDAKPLPDNLNVRVWHIDETGEWFTTYKEFLDRMDFYTRHHFTCEITGASCLTFFQALDSEETQFKYVEERFPIKLREPVARFLHFNGIKRLDALVESVYSRFKNDFFPGEVVYLRKNSSNKECNNSNPPSQQYTPQPDDTSFLENNNFSNDASQPQFQRPYVVKEKAQFNATIHPSTGEILVPAYAKYMLIEETHGNQSFIADQSQIYRDRSTFTKHLIKCFCKITLTRASTKMGAPWCVKEEYLPIYGLTMEWPLEMLKYKDDEVKKEDIKVKRSHSQSLEEEEEKEEQDDQSKEEMYNQSGGIPKDTEDKTSKKKKTNDNDIKNTSEDIHIIPEPHAPPSITVIAEDLTLPYQGPPHIFEHLRYYNKLLECVSIDGRIKNFFKNFDKILEVFQFLTTFRKKLYLSEFSLDQFIITLKCSDPYELKGEVVYVDVLDRPRRDTSNNETCLENEDGEDEGEKKNNWKRSEVYRNLIKEKKSNQLLYRIEIDEPASDDIIDNINSNGTSLLIELYVSLLRLFVDEKGDWMTVVTEEWIEDDKDNLIIKEENMFKTENDVYNNEESKEDNPVIPGELEETNNLEETEDLEELEKTDDSIFEQKLNKCLNFRNVNWAERLTKRQFNNNFWMLILLGVLQDSMHIPTYTEIVRNFTEKVIPDELSSTQLPRQLWRNFCRKLTLEEKLDTLWVLVDIVCNFSPDIKAAVEESLDLCNLIRSERFRVSKEVKSEQQALSLLNADLHQLTLAQDPIEDQTVTLELDSKIQDQLIKVNRLVEDKNYLDRQLLANDFQRLRTLGFDRFGNRYYWLELNGIDIKVPDKVEEGDEQLAEDKLTYHSGRFWVQGPSNDIAKLYLDVTDDELNRWNTIAVEEGSAKAVEDIFKITKSEDGSYFHTDSGVQTKLVDGNDITNPLIELTSIQKKIIDETPERILLSEQQWYVFEKYEDVSLLISWLDTWGRREHALLRQIKPLAESIAQTFNFRELLSDEFAHTLEEKRLLSELEANELKESESISESQLEEEQLSTSEQNDEVADEDQLEVIAEEIMKLDDCAKTRQILNKIQELENTRDTILEKLQSRVHSQRPGSRVQKRAEKKRIKAIRENKIEKQSEILTDILNYRHFKAIEDVIKWKNNTANSIWGTYLRKNASGNKKIVVVDTTDSRLQNIMKHTSKLDNTKVSN